jgi:outer membrane protein assembly factor BamB
MCRLIIVKCFIFLTLIGCTKTKDKGQDSAGAGSLSNFSVTVIERTPISAIVEWDSCLNKVSNEPVKYRVILNNRVVKDSLLSLTDTLLNLESNKTYTGKIVAFINTGDTIIAEFSLSTYQGTIYAHTGGVGGSGMSRFGSFNAYPTLRLLEQPALWRFDIGLTSSPTLSNDTLFLVIGDRVEALNATTGNTIWRAPATTTFWKTITYAGERLYVCASTGELVCLDSRNGQILWSYASTTPGLHFRGTPVIENNIVFAVENATNQGEIHAVDAISGQKKWTYVTNHSFGPRLLAANGVLVISSGLLGRVFALDQMTGNLLWEKSDLLQVGADRLPPVYIDEKVIVHTNGPLYALDLKTGREIWKYRGLTGSLADCVTGNGRIYFCQDTTLTIGYTASRNVVCLDAKDGHEVWKHRSTVENEYYSHLVFAKDKIYCLLGLASLSYGPRIVAFNATNGKRDLTMATYNPVYLASFEQVRNFCIKRDGKVYYSSFHGNYK